MTDTNNRNSFYSHLQRRLLTAAPSVDILCTHACVLLPIIYESTAPHLIFTRRTMTVRTHKGQISFPGGIMEPSDSSAEAAALREAHEEIGLPPNNVEIVGYLDGLRTVTDFWITPVVGIVTEPFDYIPAEAEVDEVIEIPIQDLVQESKWQFETREYNGTIYRDCRFPFNGHIIWGATGKLTWALMQKMR